MSLPRQGWVPRSKELSEPSLKALVRRRKLKKYRRSLLLSARAQRTFSFVPIFFSGVGLGSVIGGKTSEVYGFSRAFLIFALISLSGAVIFWVASRVLDRLSPTNNLQEGGKIREPMARGIVFIEQSSHYTLFFPLAQKKPVICWRRVTWTPLQQAHLCPFPRLMKKKYLRQN